jgi:hypothetical protein
MWLEWLEEREIHALGIKVNVLPRKRERLVEEYFQTEKYVPYDVVSRMLYSIPDKTLEKFDALLKRTLKPQQYCCTTNNMRILMPQKKFYIRLEELEEKKEPNPEDECPICFIVPTETVKTNCGHTFCAECTSQHFKASNSNYRECIECPYCRTTLSSLQVNTRTTYSIYKKKYLVDPPPPQQSHTQPPTPTQPPPPHTPLPPLQPQQLQAPQNTILNMIYHFIGF